MKKVLFLMTVLCGISVATFAQSSKEGGKWNIGLEAGLPVGDLHNSTSFAGGISVKYEHPIATATFFTISAGYSRYFYNDDAKAVLKAFGVDKSGEGLIPVKAGLKYYFNEGFFGEAQAGAGFSTESGGGTAFVYAPGIGYTFAGGFEAGVRYEGYSSNGRNTAIAGLRLGYRF